jgi:hypothetical protein
VGHLMCGNLGIRFQRQPQRRSADMLIHLIADFASRWMVAALHRAGQLAQMSTSTHEKTLSRRVSLPHLRRSVLVPDPERKIWG